ncbi:MAG TPA: hypothetical protein VK217_08505 [Acidimicrobiales bacterium]|nr:hypothetical protein [Acidimicrobiales bacterium]
MSRTQDASGTRKLPDGREVMALDMPTSLIELLGSRGPVGPLGAILRTTRGQQAISMALVRALAPRTDDD